MKNRDNSHKIVNKLPKKRKNPKFFLKKFLVYFYRFPREESISDWIKEKNNKFVRKSLDIVITGIFIQIAIFPFLFVFNYFTDFYIQLKLIPLFIVSYGFIWDAGEKIHAKIVNGRVKANSSLPRPR